MSFPMDLTFNLCDSCNYSQPECPSVEDEVSYGVGVGHDNVIICPHYSPKNT